MKQLILSLVMIPLLAVTLIGCGSDDNSNNEDGAYESEVAEAEAETDGEEIDHTEGLTEFEEAMSENKSLISVVFTEDGSTLFLGDERDVFDDVLGESTEDGDLVSYLDGTFTVHFEDGIATTIVSTSFERVEFPAFDVDRTISELTRDLMFGDFIEHPSADWTYLLPIEIDAQAYVFMVTLGVDDGEVSHVDSIALRILDEE